MNEIKLFIYSVQPVIVEGIKCFINGENRIKICGDTNEKKILKQELINKVPHILIIDDTGMEFLEIISTIEDLNPEDSNLDVLVYTIKEDTNYFSLLCNKGIKALVSKKSTLNILLEAIKYVKRGQPYIDNYFSVMMLRMNKSTLTYFSQLLLKTTKREKEILMLLTEGMRNKEIAERLFISPRTVEVYKINLARKLNLSGCPELLRYAVVNRDDIMKTFLNNEYLSNYPD